MKKIIFTLFITGLIINYSFSQSAKKGSDPDKETEKKEYVSKGGFAEIPAAKRPKSMDKLKAEVAASKDESPETEEKNRNTILYGTSVEVGDLLSTLIKNEDPRFTEEIYDLFQETQNSSIKQKVLQYFTKVEDPCLEDYAVELINDPYDEKNDVVNAAFEYIGAVKTKAAIPAVISIIESENEAFFNAAVLCLGEIGGAEEAVFLAEYLERDDLTLPQRQTLMRICGKMHAIETYDLLVDVLENEDENTFVRMYAAESLGLMKTEKSIKVLKRNFDSTDPNLRQYIIKGIKNFPESKEAASIIIQGIKDDHWKVRQESIKAASEMNLTSAVSTIIYRAKNDSEKVIKDECYTALGQLNTPEGNKFLIQQITDEKAGDNVKIKAVEVLLKNGTTGEKEILELAEKMLKDDRRKNLRTAIGKELAKYKRDSFAAICGQYLESKDVTTVSLGLDMYKIGKYPSVESKVRAIAGDKKANASNKKRAMKMLGIEDTPSEK